MPDNPNESKPAPEKKEVLLTAQDVNDCILHVSYTPEQMGYDK